MINVNQATAKEIDPKAAMTAWRDVQDWIGTIQKRTKITQQVSRATISSNRSGCAIVKYSDLQFKPRSVGPWHVWAALFVCLGFCARHLGRPSIWRRIRVRPRPQPIAIEAEKRLKIVAGSRDAERREGIHAQVPINPRTVSNPGAVGTFIANIIASRCNPQW